MSMDDGQSLQAVNRRPPAGHLVVPCAQRLRRLSTVGGAEWEAGSSARLATGCRTRGGGTPARHTEERRKGRWRRTARRAASRLGGAIGQNLAWHRRSVQSSSLLPFPNTQYYRVQNRPHIPGRSSVCWIGGVVGS